MAGLIVPPGGFSGFAQMTPASRASWGGRPARSGGKRRKKAKTRRASGSSSGRKRTRKMKFGSPAWQKKYKVGKHRRK